MRNTSFIDVGSLFKVHKRFTDRKFFAIDRQVLLSSVLYFSGKNLFLFALIALTSVVSHCDVSLLMLPTKIFLNKTESLSIIFLSTQKFVPLQKSATVSTDPLPNMYEHLWTFQWNERHTIIFAIASAILNKILNIWCFLKYFHV